MNQNGLDSAFRIKQVCVPIRTWWNPPINSHSILQAADLDQPCFFLRASWRRFTPIIEFREIAQCCFAVPNTAITMANAVWLAFQ
ncbi:hypothetical protein AEQ48_11585 [Pseudomonas libanensis]|uniref:Uncharacterized protein n=1 Tax=Pseudomonas libanensis TaxID=75588 RepID=A0ABR5M8J1_9PSED|nr:hypothetical protein AEQ48_11585 [Pseudomonas libanensis]MBD0704373.1 hypothetical protein [Pseudomonas sp. PSB1]